MNLILKKINKELKYLMYKTNHKNIININHIMMKSYYN